MRSTGVVDVEAVKKQAEELRNKFLESVDKSLETSNVVIAMAVYHTEYDNPVLNHPDLLKQITEKFGINIVDKLINLGMQFTSQEDRSLLNDICLEENNVEQISILMGLGATESISCV